MTSTEFREIGRRICGASCMLVLAYGGAAAGAEVGDGVNAPTIHWALVETFPLLRPDRVEELRTLSTGSALALYGRLASQWSPGKPIVANVDQTAYDRSVGSYRIGYARRKGEPVSAEFQINGLTTEQSTCRWQVQTASPSTLLSAELLKNPQIAATADCAKTVTLAIPTDEIVRVEVSVEKSGETHQYSEVVQAKQRVMVALGESYAAGEGNPDIPAVYKYPLCARPGADWIFTTDFTGHKNLRKDNCPMEAVQAPGATWWDRECHRSLVSWPVMSALTMALGDKARHTRYVILTYACSGASYDDGAFFAQARLPSIARYSGAVRDGVVDPPTDDLRATFTGTRRSQLNAMYDDLCRGEVRRYRIFEVPGHPIQRAIVEDCAHPVAIDALLLSMGGNDLGFASIAKGFLISDKPNKRWYAPIALPIIRKMINAYSVQEAEDRVKAFRAYYAEDIKILIKAAGARPDKTIVVRYPNPILSANEGQKEADKTSKANPYSGCVGGPKITLDGGRSTADLQRVRVRDINLVLGQLLPFSSFHIIHKGWVVEMRSGEVRDFEKIFAGITGMQNETLGPAGQMGPDGIRSVPFGEPSYFNGRRVCDKLVSSTSVALPLFFCDASDSKASDPINCNASNAMSGGQWSPRLPTEWRHYTNPAEEPRKYIVYSINDSVLALRTWMGPNPSINDIIESMTGSMHPTAEAHAAAADEVVNALHARSSEQMISTGNFQ